MILFAVFASGLTFVVIKLLIKIDYFMPTSANPLFNCEDVAFNQKGFSAKKALGKWSNTNELPKERLYL